MLSGTVADVVVRLPKTLTLTTTVGEARAEFADDHVHMLLLTANGFLLGTLVPAWRCLAPPLPAALRSA